MWLAAFCVALVGFALFVAAAVLIGNADNDLLVGIILTLCFSLRSAASSNGCGGAAHRVIVEAP